MINAYVVGMQLPHTHSHAQTQSDTNSSTRTCLPEGPWRRDRSEPVLHWGANQILVHFHQLSSSKRYFCRARQEIRLLNYSFSQTLCHSLLLSYSCSIKVTHWNHLSFPNLNTISTKLCMLHSVSTDGVSLFVSLFLCLLLLILSVTILLYTLRREYFKTYYMCSPKILQYCTLNAENNPRMHYNDLWGKYPPKMADKLIKMLTV